MSAPTQATMPLPPRATRSRGTVHEDAVMSAVATHGNTYPLPLSLRLLSLAASSSSRMAMMPFVFVTVPKDVGSDMDTFVHSTFGGSSKTSRILFNFRQFAILTTSHEFCPMWETRLLLIVYRTALHACVSCSAMFTLVAEGRRKHWRGSCAVPHKNILWVATLPGPTRRRTWHKTLKIATSCFGTATIIFHV